MQYSIFDSIPCTENEDVSRALTTAQLLHGGQVRQETDKDNASLLRFPSEKRVNKQKWVCNISKHLKFSSKHPHYLQIDSSEKYSQYAILRELLKANTCHVIYFDAIFTEDELAVIRHLQDLTKTELIHSKVAFCLCQSTNIRKSA